MRSTRRRLHRKVISEHKGSATVTLTPFLEPSSAIHNLNDFLFETGIDNMNMFKIEKYIKRSEIVKKVNGFCESYQVEVKNHSQDTVSTFWSLFNHYLV